MTTMATADLYDQHENNPALQIVSPLFRHFGGLRQFSGAIRTLKVLDDNSWVRKILGEEGRDQILVVDGAGSMRCALLGDMIAELAVRNQWKGIIIHGCIRDSMAISRMHLGVMALATHPRKTVKRDIGEPDVPLMFADCRWITGEYLYADEDGMILSPLPLSLKH